MWSPGCLCCSPETVQQDAAKKVLEGVPHRVGQIRYVSCMKCSSKVCTYCIEGLHEAIVITNKSKSVSSSDPSIVALRNMRTAAMNHQTSCAIGFCCSFSSSIPAEAHCTLVKPPRAPVIQSAELSSDDEEYTFVDHDESNKRCRRTLRKQKTSRAENVNFLLQYFQDSKPPASMTPPQVHQIVKAMNKSRRRSKRTLLKMNQLQGALLYPEFNLLVQSDASNVHLSCDHLALADCPCDGTPAVMHAVITAANAAAAEIYFEEHQCSLPRVGNPQRIVLRVASPEDLSKEHDFAVDLYSVHQVRRVKDCASCKGQAYFDPSCLSEFQIFGHEDIEYVLMAFRHFFYVPDPNISNILVVLFQPPL